MFKKLRDFFALYAATYAWHAHVKKMAHGHPYSIPGIGILTAMQLPRFALFFFLFFWEYVRDVNGRITSYQLHSSITSCVEKSANLFSPILFNFELHLLQLKNIFASIAKYICPESRIVSSVLSNYLARGRKGEKCANHSKHWKHT